MAGYTLPAAAAIAEHIGSRIRSRRKTLQLSQTQLAQAIGVTFQQVQKYESGSNRVAASTLYLIAAALEVEPQWFFDELPGKSVVDPVAKLGDTLKGRQLGQAFAAITSDTHRDLVLKLARALRPGRAEAAEAA